MSAMNLRPETDKAVMHIMDVFTGADGGAEFWKFRVFMEEFDKRASNGDTAAQELINVVITFNHLLNVSQKIFDKKN